MNSTSPSIHPIPIYGYLQNYLWGSNSNECLIARMLPESCPGGGPYAELWFGTHPSGPTTTPSANGKKTLLRFVTEKTDEDELSFLLKILCIEKPLSLQAHPDEQQATQLHQQKPDYYPDKKAKPELSVALSPVSILWGFQPIDQIYQFLKNFPELQEIFSDAISGAQKNQNILQQIVADIFSAKQPLISNCIITLQNILSKQSSLTEHQQWLLRLAEIWPEDRGVLIASFMNYVSLQPGEAIYTPPNTLHAYLSGEMLECLGNSDNVVRGGLTEKYIDQQTLLSMPLFESPSPALIHPQKNGIYTDSSHAFSLQLISSETPIITKDNHQSSSILLVLEDGVELHFQNQQKKLSCGDAWFIPANSRDWEIFPKNGKAFFAYAGGH